VKDSTAIKGSSISSSSMGGGGSHSSRDQQRGQVLEAVQEPLGSLPARAGSPGFRARKAFSSSPGGPGTISSSSPAASSNSSSTSQRKGRRSTAPDAGIWSAQSTVSWSTLASLCSGVDLLHSAGTGANSDRRSGSGQLLSAAQERQQHQMLQLMQQQQKRCQQLQNSYLAAAAPGVGRSSAAASAGPSSSNSSTAITYSSSGSGSNNNRRRRTDDCSQISTAAWSSSLCANSAAAQLLLPSATTAPRVPLPSNRCSSSPLGVQGTLDKTYGSGRGPTNSNSSTGGGVTAGATPVAWMAMNGNVAGAAGQPSCSSIAADRCWSPPRVLTAPTAASVLLGGATAGPGASNGSSDGNAMGQRAAAGAGGTGSGPNSPGGRLPCVLRPPWQSTLTRVTAE
jgi:hypothetical protein